MQAKEIVLQNNKETVETLASFIKRDCCAKISHKALFVGFKHRMKVEFLKSFVV